MKADNFIKSEIDSLLPHYNCGSCGCNSCSSFASQLLKGNRIVDDCSFLNTARYIGAKGKITEQLKNTQTGNRLTTGIVGVLDRYEADILLKPLPNEHSCREILMPMLNSQIEVNDIISYRPLGCPIIHFAKVLQKNGMLVTVHIIGPCTINEEQKKESRNIGNCMVIGFEGVYSGEEIHVGQTVRFLPHHCMMQKVHSGVVVNIEGKKVLLEGIDLKVWYPPATKST